MKYTRDWLVRGVQDWSLLVDYFVQSKVGYLENL
jgi:hypothetical protein